MRRQARAAIALAAGGAVVHHLHPVAPGANPELFGREEDPGQQEVGSISRNARILGHHRQSAIARKCLLCHVFSSESAILHLS